MKTIEINNEKDLERYKDKYGYKIPWNAVFNYSADFKGGLEVEWYLYIEKECSMMTEGFIKAGESIQTGGFIYAGESIEAEWYIEVGGHIKAGGYIENWEFIEENIITETRWKKIKEVKPSKFKQQIFSLPIIK